MHSCTLCWPAGQTYEESAIRRWLSAHSTCPSTNKKLSSKQLIPNYSLKHMIHTWAKQHGVRLADHNPAPHMVVDLSDAAPTAAGAASFKGDQGQQTASVGKGSSSGHELRRDDEVVQTPALVGGATIEAMTPEQHTADKHTAQPRHCIVK